MLKSLGLPDAIRVPFLEKLLGIDVLTTGPIALLKPTNALGQDAVNQDVIRVLLSSNIIKSCTLSKKTGALLKSLEE